MRIKALLLISLVSGAFGLVGGAVPAHACTTDGPSTACTWWTVCMAAGPKIGPKIGC